MKILLAYDGFEHSDAAVREVADLARDTAGSVTIVSVVPPQARGSKAGGHVGLRPHAHEDVARAHAYLRDQGTEAEMVIEHGDPVERISALAAERGSDLIVVGSRRLGRVGRLVLGSVSGELARRSPCPLVVAGDDRAESLAPIGS